MKDLMGKEITKEQMDKYEADLKAFKERMYLKEPKKESYGYENKMFPDEQSERAFQSAYSQWHMALHCDAPNKPGYYRANND